MANRSVQDVLGLMQKNLECAICLDLLKHPISTKCDHQFCRFCITEFIQNKRSVPCPLCKKPVTKRALTDRPELGEIVENVRKLISAYQEDTGRILSPPKGPDVASFFPCTPEPLPSKVTRGTKRKIKLTEQNNEMRERTRNVRQTKRKKAVEEEEDLRRISEEENSATVSGENDVFADDIFLLEREDSNDELLDYLENGSCGARTHSGARRENISSNDQVDYLTSNKPSRKKTNISKRGTSANKKIPKEGCPSENSNLGSCDSHKNVLLDVDINHDNEVCDETGDAKCEIGQSTTRNSDLDNCYKKCSMKLSLDEVKLKRTSKNHSKIQNDKQCKLQDKDVSGDNLNNKHANLGKEILNIENTKIQNEGGSVSHENFKSDNVGFGNEIEHDLFVENKLGGRRKENDNNTMTLRERKVKSMKELSDSFDENSDNYIPANSQISVISEKLSDNEELFNTPVPIIDKTYSRKNHGQDKNKEHRVKEWLQNIQEKKENSRDENLSFKHSVLQMNEPLDSKEKEEMTVDIHVSSTVNIDHSEEDLQPVVLQRKRIFKTTRNPNQQHHDMAISQCKGNLSFKVMNPDRVNKSSQIQDNRQKIVCSEIKKKCKDVPFVWEGEKDDFNIDVVVENSKNVVHLDAGQESDPYEFKSSQKTPVRENSKDKKTKLKKGRKKGQLQVKLMDKFKKGDENNPVEIIDEEEELSKDLEQNKNVGDLVDRSPKRVTDQCTKSLNVGESKGSVGSRNTRKSKKQKSPELTQKDFDDLEKLKDKINDAEDYDLLTSTQEATDKLSMEIESESLMEIIPDTEYTEEFSLLKKKDFECISKPKKKVSFCNNVTKHLDALNAVDTEVKTVRKEQNQVKILKKMDSPDPLTIISETQNLNSTPNGHLYSKLSDKETQDEGQIFKHPGDIVSSDNKKHKNKNSRQQQKEPSNVDKLEKLIIQSSVDKENSSKPLEEKPCAEIEKDTSIYLDTEDVESCSSGTDDLSVDPSQEEFECPNLEIQPNDIREKLSQGIGNQYGAAEMVENESLSQSSENGHNKQTQGVCSNTITCVQETPQVHMDKEKSPSQSNEIQNTQNVEDLQHKSHSKSQTGLRRQLKKTKQLPKSNCVTPVISIVKETPSVAVVTPSVSMVTETQLSSTGLPETPVPLAKKLDSGKNVSPFSSSIETVIGESQSLPSFMVNQMKNECDEDVEPSSISENRTFTSGESLDESTQQSISLLILPDVSEKVTKHNSECEMVTGNSSQNNSKRKSPSPLDASSEVIHKETGVEKSLINDRSDTEICDSGLKTRRNKLKKKRSKSPASSSVDSTQLSISCDKKKEIRNSVDGKRNENLCEMEKDSQFIDTENNNQPKQKGMEIMKCLGSVEYVPSTVGASKETTPIIQVTPLVNSKKEADVIPETMSGSFMLSENIVGKGISRGKIRENSEVDKKFDEKRDGVSSNENCNDKADMEIENKAEVQSQVLTKVDVIDLDEDNASVPEELTQTLVSLKTIRKLERSHSKLRSSPDDIFMLDSETPVDEDTCDTDIPQNQEGFINLASFDSEISMEPSQSIKAVDLEMDKDTQEDTDGIKMLKLNEDARQKTDDDDVNLTCQKNYAAGKITNEKKNSCSGMKVDETETQLKMNLISDLNNKADKISPLLKVNGKENYSEQRVTRNSVKKIENGKSLVESDIQNLSPKQSLKKDNSESETEAVEELRKVKVKSKTRRGLASRMRTSAYRWEEDGKQVLSDSSAYVDSEQRNSASKVLHGDENSNNSDTRIENQPIGRSDEIISPSLKKRVNEKVSPTFSYSPHKTKYTPTKRGTPNSSQNLEHGVSSFPAKRRSLTFVKRRLRKSGINLSDSHHEDTQELRDSQQKLDQQESVSIIPDSFPEENVLSISQRSQTSQKCDSVEKDTCIQDDVNNSALQQSVQGNLKKNNSKHTTDEECKHSNDQDFVGQTLNKVSSESQELKNNMKCSQNDDIKNVSVSLRRLPSSLTKSKGVGNKIFKKKRVTPIQSDSSEDELFERSSPLPDMLGVAAKRGDKFEDEDHTSQKRIRQNVSSDDEDDEALLIRHEADYEPVTFEDKKISQSNIQPVCDKENNLTSPIGSPLVELSEDDESDDSDNETVVRKRKNKNTVITDDSCSDDDSSQDSSHQMNLTSSSALSSQSEAMTSQQKTELEKDLERMRKQILDLEAQLSAKKRSDNPKLNRSKTLKSSDISIEHGSMRKVPKRKRVKVRCISSDSSDENEDELKDELDGKVVDLLHSSGKVTAVNESGEEKSETEDIHQYPSSGDESDELFLSPLPPSPPPSQVEINIQINLPEEVKKTDEFLKQVMSNGQSSDNEPSSPILSQTKLRTFSFSGKDSKTVSNSYMNLKDVNHSSPQVIKMECEGPLHSSPLVTKMDLKNTQHSTPLRKLKRVEKKEELCSPMFQNHPLSQKATTRPVLSPIVCNKDTKEGTSSRNKCFVASGLQIEEMKEIQKLAMLNDCKFQPKFSPSVTHVIVNTKPFGCRVCDRTLKFFQGLSNKCWIVDYQWVMDSREAGYLLPEEDYEIKGDTVTCDNHNGPRRVRLSKKQIFKDFQICIISTSEGLTPDNLSELFITCGGSVVSNPKQFSSDIIKLIVTCTDYDEETPTQEEIKTFNRYYRQYGTITVTREWALDSLTLNTIQPLQDYVLTTVKGMTIPGVRR